MSLAFPFRNICSKFTKLWNEFKIQSSKFPFSSFFSILQVKCVNESECYTIHKWFYHPKRNHCKDDFLIIICYC